MSSFYTLAKFDHLWHKVRPVDWMPLPLHDYMRSSARLIKRPESGTGIHSRTYR